MNRHDVLALLEAVRSGALAPQSALERLSTMPYEDMGFARIDHHRSLRLGIPEVIYAEGKSPDQVAEIFARTAASGSDVLATRVSAEAWQAISARVPVARFYAVARAATLRQPNSQPTPAGTVAVLCAGTSDLPVAEEAAVTAEFLGAPVERYFDVGVAGLHRLLAHHESLQRCEVAIVCAGMEGALPSVVGGLVPAPVIAVPTSVGYGAAFHGLAALLGMLNSCSPNVTVVNIDNGFGAAINATLIARKSARPRGATRNDSSSRPEQREVEGSAVSELARNRKD
jgi:pyridinium-3,5-biscarboxylic acid mononucleotide synthase